MTDDVLLRVYPQLRFAYRRRSLLITDENGMIGADGSGPAGIEGLYEHAMRILSRYRLLVNGRPPQLDTLSPVEPYSTLGYYYCPPSPPSDEDERAGGEDWERGWQVVIRLARFVGQGLHEDLDLTNHGPTVASLAVTLEVAADFADLYEAREGRRLQSAPIAVEWRLAPDGQGELRFEYQHPRLRRGVILRLHGTQSAPTWDGSQLAYALTLAPQERAQLCLDIAPVADGTIYAPRSGRDGVGENSGMDKRESEPAAWTVQAMRIETSTTTVRQAWNRAITDLGALALGEGLTPAEHAVPAAGIPLYDTLFGRDALTTGGQALMFSPVLAEGALRLVARYLGDTDNDFYDEQPGRVPQQVRDDPLALLGLRPYLHDYGDYAAPCAYLVLVGAHHLTVGDAELTREFLEPAKRVMDWLETRADLDGDGFLEYKTRSPQGQKNQGWKDSPNAVVYPDGRQVEPPTATCELQGYWYAARLLMAEVFFSLGDPSRALDLYRQAEDLKRKFNERFWMPDEHFLAFALDADKRQVKSIASNAGQCLTTGIVEREHAADVVKRLMAPDMFSGWGIRTLSSDHPVYNPFSYHLGSVWPSENATIALGMKRYGFAAETNALVKGLFDAAALFEHTRLPETFGGHPRDPRHRHPGIYPGACAPQAWSASAIAWLVQSMLGLWSYAPLNALIVDPELPEWLPELTLRGLRIKDARVTIQFTRDRSGATDYRVLEREGTLHVLRQPPPQAPASPLTRLRDLVESLLPGK